MMGENTMDSGMLSSAMLKTVTDKEVGIALAPPWSNVSEEEPAEVREKN